MLRNGSAKLRQWVERRRPSFSDTSTIPEKPSAGSDGETSPDDEVLRVVGPVRRMATVAREAAQRLAESLEALKSVHTRLAEEATEVLSLQAKDPFLDASCSELMAMCLSFLRDFDALGGERFSAVLASCDRVLRDCAQVSERIRLRDEAVAAERHYSEKVTRLRKPTPGCFSARNTGAMTSDDDEDGDDGAAEHLLTGASPGGWLAAKSSLSSTNGSGRNGVGLIMSSGSGASPGSVRDRLQRNQEKFARAQDVAERRRRSCESALRRFRGRSGVHARASLHAVVESYVRFAADLGRSATPVAEAFAAEFPPGTTVEVLDALPCDSDDEQAEDATGDAVSADDALEEQGKARQFPGAVSSMQPPTAVVQSASAIDGASSPDCHAVVVWTACGSSATLRKERLRPRTASAGAAASEDGAAVDGAELTAEVEADHALDLTAGDRVKLEPASWPCNAAGEAEISCCGLEGTISEVLVDGQPLTILSATRTGARILVPPGAVPCHSRIEVRAEQWRRHVAATEAALRRYVPVEFGMRGQNVALTASKRSTNAHFGGTTSVASRTDSLLRGVALTATPLPPLQGQSKEAYYFEIEILAMASSRKGTTRTLSLGFAWAPDARVVKAAEMAGQLPRTFVVGSDLPRVFIDGKEGGRLVGWRPMRDVDTASVIGVLLEVESSTLRLTIFQDGTRRCSTEASLPSTCQGAPHGVVDVCGTVQSVELRQDVLPPGSPAQVSADGSSAPGVNSKVQRESESFVSPRQRRSSSCAPQPPCAGTSSQRRACSVDSAAPARLPRG